MLHIEELLIIAKWIEETFRGDFYFTIAKGFEDNYIIVETNREENRQVFAVNEILRKCGKGV